MKQPSLFDPPKRKPAAKPISAAVVRRMAALAEASEFLAARVRRHRKTLPPDQRRMAARLVSEVEGLIERMGSE